jgi:hypothetical protein
VNLDKANKWLSVIANLGVVVGIVFLAYELRQNTLSTDLEVASNFQSSFTEIEMLIAGDSEFSEILVKGRSGLELTDQERLRLAVFYTNVLRHWQNVHYQYFTNALDEHMWLGQREYFTLVLSEDLGLREHWKATQSHYSPRFNVLMKGIVHPKK